MGMKRALIDASSAILLYKAALFEAVASAYDLAMAPAVFQEVTVADRPGAAHFDAACRLGRIDVPCGCIEPRQALLGGLGAGERETLCIYAAGGVDFVILDDRKGANYCRSQSIPYINALLCPKILHWAGLLDRPACTRAFDYLLGQGRYSSHVIEFAKKCNHQRLAFFMPDEV
jgi:hypothetical protein